MRTYARIDADKVAELFSTDADITTLFNPDLRWVEVLDAEAPEVGWSYDGLEFAPPAVETAVIVVPDEVPMASARIVLLRNGVDDAAVKAAIAASLATDAAKAEALIDWEFRPMVRRTSSLTQTLGPALALTEAQIDAMFVAASQLG